MRLFEIDAYLEQIPVTEAQHFIDTKCSAAKGLEFYRGIKFQTANELAFPPDALLGRIRRDRIPLDSSMHAAKVFDLIMEYMNWPFRKANTLSITTSTGQSRQYGKSYQIWPFDGCTYLYSNDIGDFGVIPGSFISWIANKNDRTDELQIRLEFMNNPSQFTQYIDAFVNYANLHVTTNLKECTEAQGEVLVYGQNYIAIRNQN